MVLILKHIDVEGPGLIVDVLKKRRAVFKIMDLWKNPFSLGFPLKGVKAVISLGGPMNVYQEKEYCFLTEEEDLLRNAIMKNIPVLGICLGAQILAKTLGANVKPADRKELGLGTIKLTSDGLKDPIFRGLSELTEVFQWHGDKFELPENSRLLAVSELCNQAFCYRERVYGFQFHFEITPEMVSDWEFKADSDIKEDIRLSEKKPLNDIISKKQYFSELTTKLINNFMDIAGG